MSEPKVDRGAWARELALLIQQESNGNKAAFARRVGISSVRNLDRWLACSVNVSEESVRQVARALNLPIKELLIKVGYYQPEELPTEAEQMLAEDDMVIRTIDESDAKPSVKRELREHAMKQRANHERMLLDEIRRMLNLAQRGNGQAG